MDYIAIVDLSKITDPGPVKEADYIEVAEKVFEALTGTGFVYCTGHGIDQGIIDRAFSTSRTFFNLPQEVKDKSLKDIRKGYDGYTRPGQELLHPTSRYEHRESYDVYGTRTYPESCPEFGVALLELELACIPLAKHILRIMAMAMKLDDKEFFIKRCKNLDDTSISSYTTVRSLYYPQVPDTVVAGAVRLGQHTDHGISTILFQDEIGGLQVKAVNGEWIPATPIPGTVLINTGDMLEFWTGGVFKANAHRVLIPEEEIKKKTHRQSLAYFIYPDNDCMITPLIGDSKTYGTVSARKHVEYKLVTQNKY